MRTEFELETVQFGSADKNMYENLYDLAQAVNSRGLGLYELRSLDVIPSGFTAFAASIGYRRPMTPEELAEEAEAIRYSNREDLLEKIDEIKALLGEQPSLTELARSELRDL